ncbi:MAG: S1 RNA-binding domain-containing protein [Thermovenabulum sp.]|uniref:S1 RNA-binding domain-containing protein n=1 Tax=Thermovenabulum sp. TaxID=3100335 RepID=UPI003C7A8BF1
MALEVGQIVEGKVTGITKFGAFVELSEGVTGLVHISEVADSYVKDVREYLNYNDVVKVKVIAISEDGKISLSIRKLKENSRNNRKMSAQSFEEKLAKFLKESEERQQDLKRYESKRGAGSGSRRRAY